MTRFPTRFPYQMMFVSFNSKKMGLARGAGTAIHSRAAELTPFYLVLFVCFVDRFWPFFAIVLSFLLRCTASCYTFAIFESVLHLYCISAILKIPMSWRNESVTQLGIIMRHKLAAPNMRPRSVSLECPFLIDFSVSSSLYAMYLCTQECTWAHIVREIVKLYSLIFFLGL